MSFLRAFSTDLPNNHKPNSGQSQQSGTNITVSGSGPPQTQSQHRQRPDSNSQNHTSTSSSSQRRHHAKALLHPMSLLLRRRSGQSNTTSAEPSGGSSYQLVASKYGPARELPDDFDPGIIYGTRHPDWTFPRRTSDILPHSGLTSTLESTSKAAHIKPSGEDQPYNHKDISHIGLNLRKRQAFFTEHFSDNDSTGESKRDISVQSSQGSYLPKFVQSSDKRGTSLRDSNDKLVISEPANTAAITSSNTPAQNHTKSKEHRNPESYTDEAQSTNDFDTCFHVRSSYESQPIEDWGPKNEISDSDLSNTLANNSSRFSFEASSTADSVRNEELTLSEGVLAKNIQPRLLYETDDRRSSDSGSFRSDDVPSIISEDLLGDDDDGFITSSIFPQTSSSIAPPPGFEHIVIDASNDSEQPQQRKPSSTEKFYEEQPKSLFNAKRASSASSERGTNGSTSDEDHDEDRSATRSGPKAPPFINPTGTGSYPESFCLQANDFAAKANPTESQESTNLSNLKFQNVFQTGAQGVSEYDGGSPSSAAPLHSPGNVDYEAMCFDHSGDDEDEDEMIAEANRDVLASDNDGWYGQEFNFYATSSTDSTYAAGGFFGIEPPKPGFIRNPSLTPISERSESSLRNSLSMVNPSSLNAGGVSAGPLSAALFAELANSGQINCDEATLSQLQFLNTNKAWDEPSSHPILFPQNPPIASTLTNSQNAPVFPVPAVASSHEYPSFGESHGDDPENTHALDISTSYTHDLELGWVMEKRKGGELITRELVRGAV